MGVAVGVRERESVCVCVCVSVWVCAYVWGCECMRLCVRVIDGARVPLRETCMHVRCAFAHSWNALANVPRKAQGPPCAGVLVRVGMSVRAPRRPGARGLRVALGAGPGP